MRAAPSFLSPLVATALTGVLCLLCQFECALGDSMSADMISLLKNYDMSVPPNRFIPNAQMDITYFLQFDSIETLDDKNMMITMIIIEDYYYFDPRMNFSGNLTPQFPTQYHNDHWFDLTNYLEYIWKPSIVYTNMVDLQTSERQVYFYPQTGRFYFTSKKKITISCNFNFTNFPNDNQKCDFVPYIFSQYAKETQLKSFIPDWDYINTLRAQDQIMDRFTVPTKYFSREVTFNYSKPVNLAIPNDKDFYSGLKYNIVITRATQFYFITYILPGIIFVVISYAGFYMGRHHATARVSLSIVTIMISVQYRNNVSEILPKVDDKVWLQEFFAAILIFNIFAMLEYAFVNYTDIKYKQYTKILRSNMLKIRARLFYSFQRVHMEKKQNGKKPNLATMFLQQLKENALQEAIQKQEQQIQAAQNEPSVVQDFKEVNQMKGKQGKTIETNGEGEFKSYDDITLSGIEKSIDDEDIEDPEIMSEISQDNPIRELRDRLEQSPEQAIKVHELDENYLKNKLKKEEQNNVITENLTKGYNTEDPMIQLATNVNTEEIKLQVDLLNKNQSKFKTILSPSKLSTIFSKMNNTPNQKQVAFGDKEDIQQKSAGSPGISAFKQRMNKVKGNIKSFDEQLYQHLNILDETYKNQSVDVLSYPNEAYKFKQFIAENWNIFKIIIDEETKDLSLEMLRIENSFSYGFFKLTSESTDDLMKYAYAAIFLTWFGLTISQLFASQVGTIISFCIGFSSFPLFLYGILHYRMWESYMSFKEAIAYYCCCRCCVKKAFKIKTQ